LSPAVEAVDGAFFCTLPYPVEFIFIRHGQSEGNAGGVFQGRADYPLTDTGREQAAERGRALRAGVAAAADRGVGVFCSPLSRARESAEIIAREAGYPAPQPLPELTELDTGAWTGKTWAELRAHSPELWQRFHSRSWAAVESAESPEALYDRAVAAWTILRDQAEQKSLGTVVAVSHGGFLQWLVRSTFGSRCWFPLLPAHNCGEFRFKVEPVPGGRAYIAWEGIDEGLPAVRATTIY
jgi:broad specificity phosphatase PhoE